MVRGKPLSPEIEGKIHAIGFLILIGLGLLVIVYDIIAPQVVTLK
jgi:membrane-associated protease RseP (regulator of RpoE activity)